jgi:glycosyltransferase involved in cell wall biosynthesis
LKQQTARPFRVLLAGLGPFEQAYRSEVTALGCDDVVRFLGFRRDVPDLIAAADLVVLPSLAEAFGLVLAEALYIGTPVVATRVGGIPEIVDDGRDGLLVPAESSAALADTLAGLLNDPSRLSAMRGSGSAKVTRKFRFEATVHAYEAAYEKLLVRYGRAHA